MFADDLGLFKKMGGTVTNLRPVLDECNLKYDTDGQYNIMNRWAFEKIYMSGVVEHTDIASHIGFVTMLSAIRIVNFVDLRDPGIKIHNLRYVKGDITK